MYYSVMGVGAIYTLITTLTGIQLYGAMLGIIFLYIFPLIWVMINK